MLSKNELKYYSALQRKKIRHEEQKFITEGRRSVEEGLNSSYKCELVILSTHFRDNNSDFTGELVKYNLRIETISNNDFAHLSDTENPQGIAAVFEMPHSNKEKFGTTPLIVALENVSDPGNAGTIIRNSDWFGVKEILMGQNSVELYNPKVVRSSMGSIFHLKTLETDDLMDSLHILKSRGYQLVCADMDGENLFEAKPAGKCVVVFSNEASGPSPELLSMCDKVLTIPRLGKAESLNVASASAVILAEITR